MLDDQDARLASRVRHMLGAALGEEYVTSLQHGHSFAAVLPAVHLPRAVEHRNTSGPSLTCQWEGWSVQCNRVVMPFIVAMSIAPQARSARNSLARNNFIGSLLQSPQRMLAVLAGPEQTLGESPCDSRRPWKFRGRGPTMSLG